MNLSDLLHIAPKFRELEQSDIDTLEQALDVRDYRDGHLFCAKPAQACALHLVVRGEIEVTYWGCDQRNLLWSQHLGPGDFFGCHAENRNDPAKVRETAQGPVTVASLPHEACNLLLHGHSPLTHRFQRIFTRDTAKWASERDRTGAATRPA